MTLTMDAAATVVSKDEKQRRRRQQFGIRDRPCTMTTRFALLNERPVADQIALLNPSQRGCFDILKGKWETKHPDDPFSDEMYLRFARCSPGKDDFNAKTTWALMKRFDRRWYQSLCVARLEQQLASKTLFPVPGLMTQQGQGVFYMRPSRYFPKQMPTHNIIDNLAYCMTTMLQQEHNAVSGLAFVANMTDWKRDSNFAVDYCFQFMMMLQGGRLPTKIKLFLIVNPPSWFEKYIWKIMKPMLAPQFRKNVHMISECELRQYLRPGYEAYLPDDMETGMASTDAMVQEFIQYRRWVEQDETENSTSHESSSSSSSWNREGESTLAGKPAQHKVSFENIV